MGKKRKFDDAFIGAVVDRSGSMSMAANGVIDGFNEFRREQASNPGNAWLTLSLFDDRIEQPYVAWNCRDIPDITHETYYVRGMTALNDAFVAQIEQMERWLVDNPWFKGKKVVMVITDGFENASVRYPNGAPLSTWSNGWHQTGVGARLNPFTGYNGQVQALSQRKKREGWEFVVFAANVDGQQIARQLGIEADRAHQFTADERDSRQVFAAYSMATTSSRGGDNLAYSSTLSNIRSDQNSMTALGNSVIPGDAPTSTSAPKHKS